MGTLELLTCSEICREIGQRCRRLRLQAKLSQPELAKDLPIRKNRLAQLRRALDEDRERVVRDV